jgi:hypothetical protein
MRGAQGPFHDPAAEQDGEGVQIIGPADDLQRDAQGISPGGEPVRLVTGVGPGQPDARAGAAQTP